MNVNAKDTILNQIELTGIVWIVFVVSKGIRVNCISPGTFPSSKVQENKEFIRRLSEKNPANRIGVPDDIKGTVLYLSSDASRYVIGQNIMVDGGWIIW